MWPSAADLGRILPVAICESVTLVFCKRYTDDGFGVTTGSEEELKDFAAFANGIRGNIKVELRYDRRQTEFLDLW